MGIIEKYSRSINSSNLKSDEHHYDTEPLMAIAYAEMHGAEMGGMLFRLKYAGDASTYGAVFSALKEKTTKKAADRQWPKHISANKVAEISLGYWLNDICPGCSGKGHMPICGAPVLDDAPCSVCNGSGKKPLVCEANWRDYILAMLAWLDDRARDAAGEAMKRLAKDMEL